MDNNASDFFSDASSHLHIFHIWNAVKGNSYSISPVNAWNSRSHRAFSRLGRLESGSHFHLAFICQKGSTTEPLRKPQAPVPQEWIKGGSDQIKF